MTELLPLIFSIGPFVLFLIIGVIFGTRAQNRHFQSLEKREAALAGLLLTNTQTKDADQGDLVTGSTVVAYDFFRRIAILLRKLTGGRFPMHEKFMERARREAILRMAEEAQGKGASAVHNIRLVTANLGDSGSAMGGCEVLAYGTAVWTKEPKDG